MCLSHTYTRTHSELRCWALPPQANTHKSGRAACLCRCGSLLPALACGERRLHPSLRHSGLLPVAVMVTGCCGGNQKPKWRVLCFAGAPLPEQVCIPRAPSQRQTKGVSIALLLIQNVRGEPAATPSNESCGIRVVFNVANVHVLQKGLKSVVLKFQAFPRGFRVL